MSGKSTLIQTVCGWDLEPTGEALAVAGAVAEQILEAEFPHDKRKLCERLLEDLADQFRHEEAYGELFDAPARSDGIPRPISMRDISQALANG